MDNNPEKKIKQNELDTLGVDEQQDKSQLAEKEFQFLGNYQQPDKKADKPKTSLFKKLMPVIALVAIAAVLGASIPIIQKLVPATDSDQKYDITEEDEDVIELNPEVIGTSAERLEIKNSLDEFTFVRRLEKTYYIEGKENLPVINSRILSALTYAGAVKAQTKVKDNVNDWEEYGLKEPISRVTWTKGDSTHYFELGDLAPSGNYYMRYNGGDTVYTYDVNAADMFITARMDYYDTTVFAFDSSTDGPYITNFSIYSKKNGETVVADLQDLTSDDLGLTAYKMTSPIEHNFSTEKFDAVNALMSSLTSLTVFSDDISQENLEKYGLTDPEYTFTFTNVAVKNVAHFGHTSDDGYLYMYAEGKDFIYIIDKSNVNVLTYDVAGYCDVMSYSRSYDTVDTITISGGGKTYNIDIVGTAEDDNLQAYINHKYVEYENFGTLYAHIISIEVKEIGSKPAGVDPLVTITVNCLDGTTDVLKYYKINDLNSFFELNGAGRLVVSTSKVEDILTFAQQLYDGQEIVLDW